MPEPTADETPCFESCLSRLEEIVERLEAGEDGLEQALGLYEEGIKSLRQCYQLLQAAQRKIALLTGVDEAGNPVTEAFSIAVETAGETLEEKAENRGRRRTSRARPAATERPTTAMDEPSGLF